jgi:predicted glutamine amidotransferase
MCELLAMNSRLPTDVNLSLLEFARHGGETGPHQDGWGIAYAMGRDFRIIKEPAAAADSDCVRYIQAHHFTSRLVLSHIRKASLPKALSFENTHPFDRELFGRRFVFAHNGHLPGIAALAAEAPRRFQPLGQTDSEQAFCLILNLLAERSIGHAGYEPRLLLEILRELSPQLRALGRCNFLLSDGERLFAHGDNSLHSVSRHCNVETKTFQSDILRLHMRYDAPQVASLVATVPLTADESWRAFAPGEIRVFQDGEEVTL